MGRLFGTNGVRGVVGDDMTVDFAQELGRSIAAHYGEGARACIGSDVRVSSPALKAAASSGMMAGGVDVVDLGVVPTPTVHHAAGTGDYDVGVIVTASHNPPEFNGIKVVHGDGTELPPDREEAIEDVYFDQGWRDAAWDGVGDLSTDPNAADRYVDAVKAQVDRAAIAGADLDVVMDCGNGAGCRVAPRLLSDLGVDCLSINAHPDGTFPGHPSEPSRENTEQLRAVVADRGADLGAIHDGDADRCIFVDDEGRFVPGERMMALIARDVVERNGGGLVVTPVATSLAVESMVEDAGGEVDYTAVGSPIVNRRVIETGAVFGGEENGGFVFPEHQVCRDAAMTLAAGVELVARADRPLSDLLSDVPDYRTVKRSVDCPEEDKPDVMADLAEKVRDDHADVDTTDGVKIGFDDGWVLVRPSGTEPLIRVYAEDLDEDVAAERADRWVGEVDALVGGRT